VHELKSIEYRIRGLARQNEVIGPGDTCVLDTNLVVNEHPGNLAMHLKPADGLPFFLHSDGILSNNFRGRLTVTVQNFSSNSVLIGSQSLVVYLIMCPFIISENENQEY